jgi:hypothetical protein
MNLNKAKFALAEPGVAVVSAVDTWGMVQVVYKKGEREVLMTRFHNARQWSVRGAECRKPCTPYPIRATW